MQETALINAKGSQPLSAEEEIAAILLALAQATPVVVEVQAKTANCGGWHGRNWKNPSFSFRDSRHWQRW